MPFAPTYISMGQQRVRQSSHRRTFEVTLVRIRPSFDLPDRIKNGFNPKSGWISFLDFCLGPRDPFGHSSAAHRFTGAHHRLQGCYEFLGKLRILPSFRISEKPTPAIALELPALLLFVSLDLRDPTSPFCFLVLSGPLFQERTCGHNRSDDVRKKSLQWRTIVFQPLRAQPARQIRLDSKNELTGRLEFLRGLTVRVP
jgi:hypothetical protein